MKREEIKTYKDACKVIGRKSRTYKDKHLNLYEQQREDGNYIMENFKELLQDWFWGD